MGYRTWSTGDTVSAADFSSYIANQCLFVFASTTARDAAITSPAEGMFAYNSDANALYYYDGSSWTATSLAADMGASTVCATGTRGEARHPVLKSSPPSN